MAEAAANILGQRYRLLNLVGEGGMGRVYRAIDRLTGQVVALKRVLVPAEHLEFATRTHPQIDFRVALAQEFQVLGGLRHPSIISVLDYGFDGELQPFLVMDLIDGAQTIQEAAQDQPLVVQVELLMQLLHALNYLHRRDVVHRDLKPSNVLVKSGQVKVLDFGISLMKGTKSSDSDIISGTLLYMAPEILTGEPAGIAADLYAVGVIAFGLFTGRPLFNSGTPNNMLNQILNTPLDALLFDIDGNIASVLRGLLARNSHDRFPSAVEALAAFSAVVNRPLLPETIVERESFLQTSKLVGRTAEIDLLSVHLRDAVAGLGSSWLVGGESGIGKTRLLDEVRTLALVNGTAVLRGTAVSGGSRPYEVWREPLRRLILSNDLDDVEAGILRTVIPDISNLLERKTKEVPSFDSESTQARLLSTIANVFKRSEQPTLVLLENLHWADEESLVLLAWLAQMTPWLPLMIVGSYRDDEQTNLPNRLREMGLIKLKRLSPESVSELGRSMLGSAGAQPRITTLLQRETEGNPFFVIEVVRALAQEAGGLDKIAGMELPEQVFTGGVRSIIERRLSRVPPADRPLLQLAAISGNQLDLKVLAAAAPGTNVDRWVSECTDATVLEIVDQRWHFTHDKLRVELLLKLSADELHELHRQVAVAIERTYHTAPDQTSNLAYHWREAQNLEKEEFYAALAGEQALRSGAYQTAAPYLERALVLASQREVAPADGRETRKRRAYLERQLAEACYGTGDLVNSREHLEHALSLLGYPVPAGPPSLIVGIAQKALILRMRRFLPVRFAKISSEKQAEIVEAVSAYEQIVQTYYFAGEVLPLIFANLQGLSLAQVADAMTPAVRARAYAIMGITNRLIRLLGRAEYYNRRARAMLQQVDDLSTTAWVRQLTGTYSVGVGQWVQAQDDLSQAADLAFRIGHKRRWQESSSLLAFALAYQGNFAGAAQMRTEISAAARRESTAAAQAWVLLFEVDGALLRGDVNAALTLLDEVTAGLGTNTGRLAKLRVLAFRARANLYVDHQDSARQAADSALQVMEPAAPLIYLLPAYAAVAEVYTQLWEASGTSAAGADLRGSAAKAFKILKKASGAFPVNKAVVWRIQGQLNWLQGDQEGARKSWQKGLETAVQLSMPFEEALSQFEIARHLEAQDPARQPYLTQAAETFTRLGALYQLARIQAQTE